jgi:hypothetical protein
VCAVLFGDDRDGLRRDLQAKFVDRQLELSAHMGFGDTIVDAVASIIEQPASSPVFATSIRAGDFEQMLYAAPRHAFETRGRLASVDCRLVRDYAGKGRQ